MFQADESDVSDLSDLSDASDSIGIPAYSRHHN